MDSSEKDKLRQEIQDDLGSFLKEESTVEDDVWEVVGPDIQGYDYETIREALIAMTYGGGSITYGGGQDITIRGRLDVVPEIEAQRNAQNTKK